METTKEELFISNLKENIEDHPASSMLYVYRGDMIKLLEKISRLESTLEAADALIDKFGRLITSIHESVERSKAKVLLSDSDKIERLSNEVSEELKKYSYQQKAIKRNNQQSPNS